MVRLGASRWILHCLLIVHLLRGTLSSFTYTGQPDSFAEYARWRTVQDGLASFSFTTSQADALLFYLDSSGNDGGNYLAVWLEGGRIKTRINVGSGTTLETGFGSNLNDLARHSLFIKHSQNTFEFYLDNSKEGQLRYDFRLLFQTRSRVYIGGLPASYAPDYEPAAGLPPLAGCVENVLFADGSAQLIQLLSRDPIETRGLQEGCSDGCDGANCNGGTCVRNWSRREGFFCDCGSSEGVGERCTEPPSSHQLSLSGEGYNCYTLAHEPFTPNHDDVTVQLPAPLPVSGTVVAGRSADWTDSFFLFLEGSTLHYELTIGGRGFSAESTGQLRRDQEYRISTARSPSSVVITIQTVSSTNQIAVAETMELSLPPNTTEPIFSFVCLGGGALEMRLYEGVMERVLLGHIAVLETQNSTHFTPGDLISFHDNPTSPSLVFTKHGLRSDGFSFQFRLRHDQTAGILLQAGNESFTLTVAIFTSPLGDIILTAGRDVVVCSDVFILDNLWHHFELRKTERASGRGLVVTFDRNASTTCYMNGSGLSQNFAILESESSRLNLGPTTSGGIQPIGTPAPFVGCFQKIQFRTGSEVFRPNLEVPVMQHERFSGDGCRGCEQEYEEMFCRRNRGVCWNHGYRNITCECLEPFVGPTCTGLNTPSSSAPSSPSTPATKPTDVSSSTTPTETTPTESMSTDDPSVSGNSGEKDDGVDYDALGQWVGIATAIVLVLVLLSIMMVFMACFVHSQRIKRVGFYRTHENTASVTLPHFSASLKTAHSHTLNLEQNRVTAITNGRTVHPTYASGEKEFYI